jgi:haloalkane dehalogenase
MLDLPPPTLPRWLAQQMPFFRAGVEADGRKTHLVDHGEGPAVLFVHGNPTWSFLWRRVISALKGYGLRLVAPDLLGFGLSDKLPRPEDHLLERHVEHVHHLALHLGLDDVIVVGQDWGGPIATAVASRLGDRVRGVVLANTAVLEPRRPLNPTWFHKLSHVPLLSEGLFIGGGFPLPVLDRAQGERASISGVQRRAYAWPFRKLADRAGPLGLARMVPDREGHPSLPVLAETDAWVRAFHGPAALVWGLRDPILGRALKRLREALPQASVVETDAGHFLQEEVPVPIAHAILDVARGAGVIEAPL